MPESRFAVILVFLTFFVISLLTNILGPVVPDIIGSFHVSLTAAGFLAFAFFIAYGGCRFRRVFWWNDSRKSR
jgi:fucose permease